MTYDGEREERHMSERFDLSDPAQYTAGIEAAKEAISKGELIVLPTDTVYGVGADAFTPWAVSRLLAAKGRGRDMPPPVLVGTVRAATALVDDFGPFGQDLIDEFWPGGLTLVARATPTLAWDLGDTKGTVAVRMPLHAAALDLLKATGPMAVSSANTTGRPAATTVDEAMEQLGDSISVYLDGGQCGGGVASTIIDLTGSVPRLLRAGAISMDRLREVAAPVTGGEGNPPRGNGAGPGPAPARPARRRPRRRPDRRGHRPGHPAPAGRRGGRHVSARPGGHHAPRRHRRRSRLGQYAGGLGHPRRGHRRPGRTAGGNRGVPGRRAHGGRGSGPGARRRPGRAGHVRIGHRRPVRGRDLRQEDRPDKEPPGCGAAGGGRPRRPRSRHPGRTGHP